MNDEFLLSIRTYFLAARPKTLPAAIIPVLLGAVCAARMASIDWAVLFCILSSAIFIQIGTNFANDYADFKSGADSERRSGPVRVTQAGLLQPLQVKRAANVCFAIAFLLGIPLMIRGGGAIILIGLASILCGWLYTSGPFPLGYNGLGEIFVLAFFGFAAVMGTTYLLTGEWTSLSALVAIAPGFHAAALLAANNLRDLPTDRLAGKRTLAVAFGREFGRIEYALLLLTPFLIPFALWLFYGFSAWIFLPLLALPAALMPLSILLRESDGDRIQIGFEGTAKVLVLFGALFVVALRIS